MTAKVIDFAAAGKAIHEKDVPLACQAARAFHRVDDIEELVRAYKVKPPRFHAHAYINAAYTDLDTAMEELSVWARDEDSACLARAYCYQAILKADKVRLYLKGLAMQLPPDELVLFEPKNSYYRISQWDIGKRLGPKAKRPIAIKNRVYVHATATT